MRSNLNKFAIVTILFLAYRAFSADETKDLAPKQDVTIYYRSNFNQSAGEFQSIDKTSLDTVGGGVGGKALRLRRTSSEGSCGTSLPLKVSGSQDLKMVYHCKSDGFPEAGLNIADSISNDNTTPTGYRWLSKDSWTSILYYLDTFHYNSQGPEWSSRIRKDAVYNNLFFHGEQAGSKDTWMLIDDFVVYRGNDRIPPTKVTNLKAMAGDDGVHLTWEPAADNVAVMLYVISRATENGPFIKIAETIGTVFVDKMALSGEFRYRVLACDFEENLGEWSDSVSNKIERPASDPKDPSEPAVEIAERTGYRENVWKIGRAGITKGVNRNMVMCYGDSLTGATVYPLEIQSALGTKLVSAHGYAGMQTSFGKDHASQNLSYENPYIALILFGTNNKKDEASIGKAMEDLEALVATAVDRGTIPVLGTIPPRGFKDPASKPEAAYNDALIKTCRKLMIPCAHLFEEYQHHPDRSQLIAKDGVHNTAAGMAASARGWQRAVEQINFVLRDRP